MLCLVLGTYGVEIKDIRILLFLTSLCHYDNINDNINDNIRIIIITNDNYRNPF